MCFVCVFLCIYGRSNRLDLQQISFSCRWESGLRWPAMLQRGDEDLQLEVLQPQDQQQQVDVEKYLSSGQGDTV